MVYITFTNWKWKSSLDSIILALFCIKKYRGNMKHALWEMGCNYPLAPGGCFNWGVILLFRTLNAT